MSFILRDYQEEAISLVMSAYQNHKERLELYKANVMYGLAQEEFVPGKELVVIGTGGGKTVIFSEIIRMILELSGGLALVLAHRDDLINQAIDKYHICSPETVVGKVKGSTMELGGQVTVGSVASVCKVKRLKLMQQFNYSIIVIDEAHHASSNSYQTILKAFPHAFIVLVTATPDRLDNKKIIDKKPIFEKDLIKLVRAGYLCQPKARAIKTDVDLDEVHTSMGDFKQEELSLAVNTPARNNHIAKKYLEYAAGMPFIGFGVTVAHAEALTYAFQEMGIPCQCVTGETKDEQRQQWYAEVVNGSLQGLFSIGVLTEGFDLPCISCIIMGRPTMSRSLYVQMIGRGSRLHEGKDHFLILDITDNCLKHRLTPHNLNKALDLKLLDNETIEEAEKREKREQEEEEERQKQVRKLKEKRKEDMIVNLLQQFNWQKRDLDGAYICQFGNGHKLALQPAGYNAFYIWQALAPAYTKEKVQTACLELDIALQEAEKHILKLLAIEDSIPRRGEAPTEKQKMFAWRLGIEFDEYEITRGELSDLIDKAVKEKEEKKRKKKEKVEA